ncbi:MAG: FAD-dependent oxidoreductase, partial [Bacteroidota bacterium]
PICQMVHDEQVLTETKTVGYSPDDEYNIWYNGKLVRGTLNTFNYKKFIGSSWLGFFENYIIPSVEHRIQYNTPITSVTYSADEVLLASETQNFIADKVILTCPVSLLKNNEIQFNPPLPKAKQEALDKVTMWDGFKAFFEFEQKFYPAFIDYVIRPETDGQVSLYDASWGQESDRHVLGLFSVGKPAEAYRNLDDTAFKKRLLTELDVMFEGQATKHYIKHITHSWSSEAYAQGAYISDYAKPKTVSRLQKPVKNTLYFAGDAYTNGLDWGNVHNAVQSASESVLNLLNH